MGYALKAVPEPQEILKAWLPFKQLVGVTSVHTEGDYAQARATIDALLESAPRSKSRPRIGRTGRARWPPAPAHRATRQRACRARVALI